MNIESRSSLLAQRIGATCTFPTVLMNLQFSSYLANRPIVPLLLALSAVVTLSLVLFTQKTRETKKEWLVRMSSLKSLVLFSCELGATMLIWSSILWSRIGRELLIYMIVAGYLQLFASLWAVQAGYWIRSTKAAVEIVAR